MRTGALVSAFLLGFLPVLSAASQASEQAEAAVRALLASSSSGVRTFISDLKETRVSGNELRVIGEGVSSHRDGWGGVPFRFSVNVRQGDFLTRNSQVEFRDGRRLGGRSEWGRAGSAASSDVSFTSPSWYQNISSQDIRFEGRSRGQGSVLLSVFDRAGRLVREGRGSPDRNGSWAVSIRLDQGAYRATASRNGWQDGDEIRFSVGGFSGSWGEGSHWNGYRLGGRTDRRWMDDFLGDFFGGSGGSWSSDDDRFPGGSGSFRVTGPRRNEVLRSNRVSFDGTSPEGTIYISVYEGGRRIERETVSVGRSGAWNRIVTLDDGRYRAVIESGRDSVEVSFEVRSGSGGSGGGSFRITGPRQNEVVRSSRVSFNGTSPEETIYISVFEGGRRIERETVSVGSRGEWSRIVTLDDGRYRAVIESGRDSAEIYFEVRGGGGSGGSGSFRITGPRQNETVRSNRVSFNGTSPERTIYISVYEGGRRIERETVSVGSRGEWSRIVTLDDGRYRAVVESGRDSAEINFEVRGGSGGSGGSSFRVTGPRQNEVVKSSRVAFQGSSPEGTIYISVYEGSRRIERETVSVDRNGSWSRIVTLRNGRYRAVVESGRDRREISFEVRS